MPRNADEIMKAGVLGKNQNDHKFNRVYDTSKWEKLQKVQLWKGVQIMQRSQSREEEQNRSIYNKDMSPETTDNLKVQQIIHKYIKPKVPVLVNLKRQPKRDFSKVLHTTDAYKNVLRDNARADYIKSILGGF